MALCHPHIASLRDRPAALQEKIFQRLFDVAEIAKFDRRERYEYEEGLKVYRNWFSVMEMAELRGELRGEQRGEERGLEQGLKRGLEEGRKEGTQKVAFQMKQNDIPVESICQMTGLSRQEVEEL